MKISKVNHVSAGVGSKGKNGRGMLYSNPPAGNDAHINMYAHVDQLNSTAKRLYSIFNAVDDYGFKVSREDKKLFNDLKKNFNAITNQLGRISDVQKQIKIIRNLPNESFKTGKDKKTGKPVFSKGYDLSKIRNGNSVTTDDSITPREKIMFFVDACIRKAYCRVVKSSDGKEVDVKEVAGLLFYAMADNSAFKKVMSELNDSDIEVFLNVFNEDYHKTERLKKIVKSIYLKDTKTQVFEVCGTPKLAISGYESEKKKALFDFIIDYSLMDERERDKKRDEIKEFIRNYISGGNSDGIVFSETIEKSLEEISCEKNRNIKRAKMGEVKQLVRKELLDKYNDAKTECEDDPIEKYWLYFFSSETEKWVGTEINKRNGVGLCDNTRRLLLNDLYLHLYKYWLSFLAQKYIDLGKGVYHFTNFDPDKCSGVIGGVKDEYADGITSFDYERISAEDSIKRDIATYVSFAVNNFGSSAYESESLNDDKGNIKDPLSAKDMGSNYHKDAKRRLLRYFGGQSNWKNIDLPDEAELVRVIRANIAAIRNNTVHFGEDYTSENINDSTQIIRQFFEREYSLIGPTIASKYYSNNLPLFYEKSKLYGLMEYLYSDEKADVAGVPSFNRIVPRSKVKDFLRVYVGNDKISKIEAKGVDDAEKYRSAMFFMLKEIYYWGFLSSDSMKPYMDKALNIIAKPSKDFNGDAKAYNSSFNNYKNRFDELSKQKDRSVTNVCEQIMIDFSLQNDDKKVKVEKAGRAQKSSEKDKEIYQHFRMMLYRHIKEAFKLYLDETRELEFIKHPGEYPVTSETEFINAVELDCFKLAKSAVSDNYYLSWYVTAHFLSKKQINLLAGAVKTYIRYIYDIERRAKSTNNRFDKNTENKLKRFKTLLAVLNFTMNYCEQFTNEVTDYFADEDEYAKELAIFVDFGNDGSTDRETLKKFCEKQTDVNDQKIGIYYDAENPIVIRNVVLATMYGNSRIFGNNVVTKVSYERIKSYYEKKDKLQSVFKAGTCKNDQEQRLLRSFQNIKNHIELSNVVDYMDIINDMYGQLISWIYLRERDLTYMQLGFHYARLFWGEKDRTPALERIYDDEEGFKINDGFILYYINAMYSHEMRSPKGKNLSLGNFFKDFGEKKYTSGLELFENVYGLHDECVAMRNYIAHFKYFNSCDHSIDEMFGDIFTFFFSYNTNLHKSIPLIYENILAKYKLIANVVLEKSESKTYSDKCELDYPKTLITIAEDEEYKDRKGNKRVNAGLSSGGLSFKVCGDNLLAAHDSIYIKDVKSLLGYKM